MSDKPHSHDNPLTQLWVAMSGASSGHHEETPGLDEKCVAVGHEPDRFGIGGIVAVPIAVGITLLVTYVTVTLIFSFLSGHASDPIASKETPLSERLGRISSSGGKSVPGVTGQPSGEPRLDGLPKLATQIDGKEVPPYLMSFTKLPSGNWPEIYPEDLRAEVYTDYDTRKKPLADPAEAYEGNKAYARLPINTTIELLLKNADLKKKYAPVSETPATIPAKPWDKAKVSNGGQKTK